MVNNDRSCSPLVPVLRCSACQRRVEALRSSTIAYDLSTMVLQHFESPHCGKVAIRSHPISAYTLAVISTFIEPPAPDELTKSCPVPMPGRTVASLPRYLCMSLDMTILSIPSPGMNHSFAMTGGIVSGLSKS